MSIFNNRKAFNFYRSYYEMGLELDNENRLAFYDALLKAQFTGEIEEPNGIAKIVFKSQLHSIKQQIQGYSDVRKKTQTTENQTENEDPTAPPCQGPTAPPSVGPTQGPSVHSIKNIENSIENKENTTIRKPAVSVDWGLFLETFNRITGKSARVVNKKTQGQVMARLREGYAKEDIVKAMQTAAADKFHQENGFKYLTMEYITRAEIMERYTTLKPAAAKRQPTNQGDRL